MLYLTRVDVHFPFGLDPEVKADFLARDRQYCHDLKQRGVLQSLWQVAGERASYLLFDVDDHDTLHRLIEGLPLRDFLDITLTPLATHPVEQPE